MKEVIRIDKIEENEKPVEFTKYLSRDKGWKDLDKCFRFEPSHYEKVLYLGESNIDGDMFACYYSGRIDIFRGHLNSGKYE